MTANKRKVDWLNHTLEFIVVIVGILIAFQLNTCSTTRSQKVTTENHLSEIRKETIINKESIESSILFLESNITKLDTIIKLLNTGQNFSKVNFLTFDLLNYGGVYLRKNAYFLLTETGDLKFFKDFEQKQKIVNLYEYYKWVEGFNEISSTLFKNDFYPYVSDNFDLVNGTVQAEEVYNSKKFRNIVGAYARTSSNLLAKYKDCVIEIDKYLEE